MSFFESGYFQDGLKAFVYLVPLVYITAQQRERKRKHFRLLFTGLFILFLGQLLDLSDECAAIKDVFIIGKNSPAHDVLEDMVGFTLGFALFIAGIFLEFIRTDTAKSTKRP